MVAATIAATLPLTTTLLIGCGAGLAGLAAIGIGLYWRQRNQRLLQHGRRATGEVVGAQGGTTVSMGHTAYAVIRFQTERGETVEYEAMTGTPWAGSDSGRKVPILYNPANPKEARILSFTEMTWSWLFFVVWGVALWIVAPLILLFIS